MVLDREEDVFWGAREYCVGGTSGKQEVSSDQKHLYSSQNWSCWEGRRSLNFGGPFWFDAAWVS